MRIVIILFLFILKLSNVSGQQDTVLQSNIYVEHADVWVSEEKEKDIIQYYKGDVRMYKDSIFMFCDSARIIGNNVTALGSVIFVQSDTIKIFCDSLFFNGNTDKAYLYENVSLENGPEQLFTEFLIYDAGQKIGTYQDTALLQINKAVLQSKKGFYNVNEKMATFYEEVIVKSEGMTVRTDSLQYLSEQKRALFVKPTRIVEEKRKIYCESGFYDFETKNAEFSGNAQLIEEEDLAVANTILYNGVDSILTLIDNAKFNRPNQEAIGDTIVHNFKTASTDIVGNAKFIDGLKVTTGDALVYNGDSKNVLIKGEGNYQDGPTKLSATTIDYNEETKKGRATGNVIWRDTTSDITVLSDDLLLEDTLVTAIGINKRPYIINLLEADTMFMAADTLQSLEQIIVTYPVVQDSMKLDSVLLDSMLIDSIPSKMEISKEDFELEEIRTDTFNVFRGFKKVKILKTDFSAVCDSIDFSSQDSIFRLFKNPVVWADSSQFSGDTIFLHLKNKTINKIQIRRSGFIISELEPEIYNQIKGKNIDVFFKDGSIDSMNVNGNAESLYFFQDEEEAYIGVNKTICSHMTFYFLEKELEHIRFYQEPESVLTPMQDINPVTERLKGFNWQSENAPINLESIIKKE